MKIIRNYIVLLTCLLLFPFIIRAQSKTKAPNKFFTTPETLAKAFVGAFHEKNFIALKALIPTNNELTAWFNKVKVKEAKYLTQQKELLHWSNELLDDGAEDMYRKMQYEGGKNLIIKEIKTEITDKYFYKEADVYITFTNNCKIKLKDCVQSDKGWMFIHEIKIINSTKKPLIVSDGHH